MRRALYPSVTQHFTRRSRPFRLIRNKRLFGDRRTPCVGNLRWIDIPARRAEYLRELILLVSVLRECLALSWHLLQSRGAANQYIPIARIAARSPSAL